MSIIKKTLESLTRPATESTLGWRVDFETPEEMYESEEYKSLNERYTKAKNNLDQAKLELKKTQWDFESEVAKEFYGEFHGGRDGAYSNIPEDVVEDITESVLESKPEWYEILVNANDKVEQSERSFKKAEDLMEKFVNAVLDNYKNR